MVITVHSFVLLELSLEVFESDKFEVVLVDAALLVLNPSVGDFHSLQKHLLLIGLDQKPLERVDFLDGVVEVVVVLPERPEPSILLELGGLVMVMPAEEVLLDFIGGEEIEIGVDFDVLGRRDHLCLGLFFESPGEKGLELLFELLTPDLEQGKLVLVEIELLLDFDDIGGFGPELELISEEEKLLEIEEHPEIGHPNVDPGLEELGVD